MNLTKALLDRYQSHFDSSEKNRVAMNAVTSGGVHKSAKNSMAESRVSHQFSVQLPQAGITHQEKSGRCWLFAATNVLRFYMAQKYNLEDFELSQNFLLFYDKLEKANYFLETILDTLEEPTEGRLLAFLLSSPENDGGQWDMFCNIVKKYGLVPKAVMNETACSSATEEMESYLTEKLRQSACLLRKGCRAGKSVEQLRAEKENVMEDIYRMLCICLGTPPREFDFEIRNKKEEYIASYGITPLEFYEKYIGINLDDYVSVINAPTWDKPFNRCYTVKYLGNVKEGDAVRYLNLSIEEMKEITAAQLKDGSPVWFGCDVGKRKVRESGVMALDVYGLEELFGASFEMTKGERLDYGQSLMTHAMVFQGVNLNRDGKADRWRVENSWGEEIGKKGYFVMDDDWFTEYMYQVVVHKKYLTEEQLKQYGGQPILLEPWDPMGSLAVVKG